MRGNFNTSNIIGEQAQVIVVKILEEQKNLEQLKLLKERNILNIGTKV